MNTKQIEENIKKLISDVASNAVSQDDFIYEMMLAYGHRKSSITRVRSGERNLATIDGEIHFKRHLYFKNSNSDSLHADIDRMKNEKLVARDKIRFLIATDYKHFLAVDTKTNDTLDIELTELPKHFDFFLPWAGMEKAVYQGENPADVKAAEKMAKLFDLIRSDNFDESNNDDIEALHNLNVFLTRLLFCFFAEDTEIFASNQFSHAIESHTKSDGSDVNEYLNRLFEVLNTEENKRQDLPDYLSKFPFVNGGLFADDIPSPKFSIKSRKILIECGSELDWSDINPDIFGSMIQAVVHPDQRGGMGMHYTSVTNIMKVIEPLFLNTLYEEFEKHENTPKKLWQLLQRIGNIKIFDPACGSGNFLIIAYKELRKLEMEIFKRIQELEYDKTGQQIQPFSELGLSQFYGIELDDFAHEVAILSLWLAEHQMNVEFKAEFGDCSPTLPLHSGGNIICGNSLNIDWQVVCPLSEEYETYILGNPPYLGDKLQTTEQKKDLAEIFKGIPNSKAVDYIVGWFIKAARYINENASFAFVSTNSICQGVQVPLIWPHIFSLGLEISFAHRSFVWSNNAKNKAAVICVIVGVQKVSKKSRKYIFSETSRQEVKNINSYLVEAPNIVVSKHPKSISGLPPMLAGNIPRDKGYLMLTNEEKEDLIESYPESLELIRQIMGSKEFINGITRWCLWVSDEKAELAFSIPPIVERLEKIKEYRINGSERGKLGIDTPYKFERTITCKSNQLIIPRVSSERREYIPIGYLNKNVIISDAAQAIYDALPFVFSVISSKAHMTWIRMTAGRMKSDYRYSSGVCYNSFPLPKLSPETEAALSDSAFKILSVRESFPDKNLASLYDPNKMPQELRDAHDENDRLVETLFQPKGFNSESELQGNLFKNYEKMTGGQNA